jgi:excinuclease ABC subunit C
VHRFGISFHRNQRSKNAIQNELEKIEGIGKQTADTLLKEFKSVKKIRMLPISEIEKIIGKAKASLIFEALHRDEA